MFTEKRPINISINDFRSHEYLIILLINKTQIYEVVFKINIQKLKFQNVFRQAKTLHLCTSQKYVSVPFFIP
jgi:hypothetical protein